MKQAKNSILTTTVRATADGFFGDGVETVLKFGKSFGYFYPRVSQLILGSQPVEVPIVWTTHAYAYEWDAMM
jgi:hypothetical protein